MSTAPAAVSQTLEATQENQPARCHDAQPPPAAAPVTLERRVRAPDYNVTAPTAPLKHCRPALPRSHRPRQCRIYSHSAPSEGRGPGAHRRVGPTGHEEEGNSDLREYRRHSRTCLSENRRYFLDRRRNEEQRQRPDGKPASSAVRVFIRTESPGTGKRKLCPGPTPRANDDTHSPRGPSLYRPCAQSGGRGDPGLASLAFAVQRSLCSRFPGAWQMSASGSPTAKGERPGT